MLNLGSRLATFDRAEERVKKVNFGFSDRHIMTDVERDEISEKV